MHGGATHLVLNMQSLYTLGTNLERFSGKTRFLCVYAAGGICGSLLSLFLVPNPSLGASGRLPSSDNSVTFFSAYSCSPSAFSCMFGTVTIEKLCQVMSSSFMSAYALGAAQLQRNICMSG